MDTLVLVVVMFIMSFMNTAFVTLLETYRFPDDSIFVDMFGKLGETDFTERWYEVKGLGIMISVILMPIIAGLVAVLLPLVKKILQWRDRGWTCDEDATQQNSK